MLLTPDLKARILANRDEARLARAKAEQDYDGDPPRCLTCVYFKRQPLVPYVERTLKGRSSKKVRQLKIKARAHHDRNPIVDRCTFGNFQVNGYGVCNEWRNRAGERIVEAV